MNKSGCKNRADSNSNNNSNNKANQNKLSTVNIQSEAIRKQRYIKLWIFAVIIVSISFVIAQLIYNYDKNGAPKYEADLATRYNLFMRSIDKFPDVLTNYTDRCK